MESDKGKVQKPGVPGSLRSSYPFNLASQRVDEETKLAGETLEEFRVGDHGTAANNGDTLVEPSQFAEGSQNPDVRLGEAQTIAARGSQGLDDTRGSSKLLPGGTIGRLVLGEVLGTGAFGQVVSAYDPELKRKLAVKILKAEVFESDRGQDAQRRLLREARAMAKISHPNVVTVHDIGTVEGQVFVAMEFVRGGNLRSWLDEETRCWKEIVEKFALAGQGLAAAHSEGLVHRDFKPDNVLVGTKGEVRVADFGLVSIGRGGEDKVVSSEFIVGAVSDEIDLTQAGALMGTALFMAPEQHLGQEATAASDQFAFCASLYVALTGQQPYHGTTYKQLRENVLAGKLRSISSRIAIPRWLRAALRKGLETKASERHPSMDVLNGILQTGPSDRTKRRRRILAVPLVAMAALGVFFNQNNSEENCADANEAIGKVWGTDMQLHLSEVFVSNDRSSAYAVFSKSMDKHVMDWRSVYGEVCEIIETGGSNRSREVDNAQSCLDQRLNYLKKVNEELGGQVKAAEVDRAVSAVVNLVSLSACLKDRVVLSTLPLPQGTEERETVRLLAEARDDAQTLFDLGKLQRAAKRLEPALEAPLTHAPTRAKAVYLLGQIKTDMGKLAEGEVLFHKAIDLGTKAQNDILVARSWLALVHLEGVERENYQRSHEYARFAELALIRGRASDRQMASWMKSRSTVLIREGKIQESISILEKVLPMYVAEGVNIELARTYATLGDAKVADGRLEEGIEHYRLALAHIESLLGADHPENIFVLNNMAVALKNNDQVEAAKQTLLRSLVLTERSTGKSSFPVVVVLSNLISIHRRLGELDAAITAAERAIEVGKVTVGADSPRVTNVMTNLAIVWIAKKEYVRATSMFREILLRNQEQFEGDHPSIASALNNVGESLLSERKASEALEFLVPSKEMKQRLFGAKHPKSASTYATLASAYEQLGHLSDADDYLNLALNIYSKAAGATHSRTIYVRSFLARVELQLGKSASALKGFEKAIVDRGDASVSEQAEDRFGIVQALWALGRRAPAKEGAKRLVSQLSEEPKSAEVLAELNSWLSAH